MKAVLTTACGCSKMVDIADHLIELRVPCNVPFYGPLQPDEHPRLRTRTFRFDGITRTLLREPVAYYKEVLE